MQKGYVSYIILIVATASFLSACSGSKQLSSSMSGYTLLDTVNVIGSSNVLSYKASATRHFDLINTKLFLRFDWQQQHVLGEAYLSLKPYFYDQQTLVLDAKGFEIHKLGIFIDDKVRPLKYSYESNEIAIDLGNTYTRDEAIEIYIAYTAKPNTLVKEGPSLKDNKGLYFIDPLDQDPYKPEQIWTQGETESSSCWFPTIDNPNERCTQEVYVTVQDKYVTLSNGLLISQNDNGDGTRTDYWKQSIPHAPYLFALVVGDYAVVDDKWRDIEVDYYVEPEYADHAKAIFGNTPEMLEFYSDYFGVDYPWEKYHQIVVRDFIAGAMENTTATIHFEGLHQTERELIDWDHEDIIAHEAVHHWFGDLVTCESWANIPLNEAFATYGEYLWMEYKYGRDKADYHLNRDLRSYLNEARSKQVPLIRFYYDHQDDMFDRHSYQKGGRVLHMLRDYVGEEAFRSALQLYLIDNSYRPAEIHHLRMAFEEITGEDLNWFFNQWFMKAGHPILTINYEDRDGSTFVTVDQAPSTSSAGLFKMPIAIDIYTEKGVERKDVTITESVTEIEIKSESKPLWINVDANKMLICEKEDNKSIEQWVYQYDNGPLFMDRYEALNFLKEEQENHIAYETIKKAFSDPYFRLREYAIAYIEVKDEDMLSLSETLSEMALEDPSAKVRSEAIYALTDLEYSQLTEIISLSMEDESYEVIGASLNALIDVDSAKAVQKAIEYKDLETFEIQNAVGRIFATLGGKEQYEYFENSIKKTEGYLKYNYLYYFGSYLSKMSINEIRDGLPILKNMALNSTNNWHKTAGKEAIERIQVAYNSKKRDSELALKRADGRDLALVQRLENNIKSSDAVLELVDSALQEIKMMN